MELFILFSFDGDSVEVVTRTVNKSAIAGWRDRYVERRTLWHSLGTLHVTKTLLGKTAQKSRHFRGYNKFSGEA